MTGKLKEHDWLIDGFVTSILVMFVLGLGCLFGLAIMGLDMITGGDVGFGKCFGGGAILAAAITALTWVDSWKDYR